MVSQGRPFLVVLLSLVDAHLPDTFSGCIRSQDNAFVLDPTVTVHHRYSVHAPPPMQDEIEHAEHVIDIAVSCRALSSTPPSPGATGVTGTPTPEPSAAVSGDPRRRGEEP